MRLHSLRGPAISQHLGDLARLRIQVFREWPYLYEGDLDNEARYLETFAEASSATLVVVEDEGRVVGASSALALEHETKALRRPFTDAGLDVKQWYYLAESVLRPEYRGRGFGHRFFEAREAAGLELGFRQFAFCAVVREAGDPRRPASARALEPFWHKRGYRPTELEATLSWREVDSAENSKHVLRFWVKGEVPEHIFAAPHD